MNPKLSLVIGILCISFSPIFVRLAGTPALTSAFYRIFVAWVCIAPYCIIKGKLKINTRHLLIAIAGGIIFASDIAVWNLSLLKISATVSTLLANLAPLWVGLFSFLLFRKRSGMLFWIGTAIAIAGMIVLVGFQNVISLKFNTGVRLALLASVFYAIYIMLTKGILQKIETITFMFYNMLSSSLFLLAICAIQHNDLVSFSLPSWLSLIGCGLICQLLGWLTINHTIKHLDPTKVSLSLLSQTVIAGFWAILFLNEKLELKEVIGSVIVLAGIAVTFLRPQKTQL